MAEPDVAIENKLNRKQIAINTWKDPEIRKRRIEALRKAHRSEQGRKNHSDASKRYFSIPENVERRKVVLKETWAKPENRKKLDEIIKIGLEAASTDQARKNHKRSQNKPELKAARSQRAKKNLRNLLTNRKNYSKLNQFLEMKMSQIGLFPEPEHPVGPYMVDFCFPDKKLIVEADGDWWHANPAFMKERDLTELHPIQKKMAILDKAKNTYAMNHGWTILRFWERDVYRKTESCLNKIISHVRD